MVLSRVPKIFLCIVFILIALFCFFRRSSASYLTLGDMIVRTAESAEHTVVHLQSLPSGGHIS